MKYIKVAHLNHDIRRILPKLPADIDIVVAIPRDGIIVAALIGLYRSIPFIDVDGFCNRRVFTPGKKYRSYWDSGKIKKVLLVDDTMVTGDSMAEAQERILALGWDIKLYTAAIYLFETNLADTVGKVDFYSRVLPKGQLIFEWYITHQESRLADALVDLDGVLCANPTEEQLTTGKRYLEFIKTAGLALRPMVEIGTIITGRNEEYREPTTEWLEQHGISYRNIIMRPGEVADHAKFKADHYRKSTAKLFIESSVAQAKYISVTTGKPVLCIGNNTLYPGDNR